MNYLLSILFLSCMVSLYGQKVGLDSVCVFIDDKMELNLTIYDYKTLKGELEKDLKSLQVILKDNKDITETGYYSITYEPDKLLSFKNGSPGERIIWDNGKQTRYHFDKKCIINSGSYHMMIQFNNLGSVVSDSLIIKINQVVDSVIADEDRFTKTYNYSYVGTTLIHQSQLDKISGQQDVLSLKGGVGVNLIRNQPVIDLSAEVGFQFAKNGLLKNQFYLSYNQLSSFDLNSNVNMNGFFNVGYRKNLSNALNNPNWLGVEIGYLTLKNGDLFGKNTFRFGLNWEVGKYITVSPQLYFSNSGLFPAIRIGFGL